jgi:hypothetical protein
MHERDAKKNFVKINLSRYVPALVEFIGELDFPWDRIDRKVLEPMAYLSYTYPGGYKHFFKPIGTLFLE